MQCVNPIRITYKKEGCKTDKVAFVPCGKCACCRSNHRNAWKLRLQFELKQFKHSYVATLTYNDDNVPVCNYQDSAGSHSVSVLCRRDLQLFFKRLRARLPYKIKYYGVAEYGSHTYRPHYHIIFFCDADRETFLKAVSDSWRNPTGEYNSDGSPVTVPIGFICFDSKKHVTDAAINYVTKYFSLKADIPSFITDIRPQFSFMSKNLGLSWLNGAVVSYYRHCPREKALTIFYDGHTYYMPRYYSDKLYTFFERQCLIAYRQKLELARSRLLPFDEFVDSEISSYWSTVRYLEKQAKLMYKGRIF